MGKKEIHLGGGYIVREKGGKVTLTTPAIETVLDGKLKAILPKEIVSAFNKATKKKEVIAKGNKV